MAGKQHVACRYECVMSHVRLILRCQHQLFFTWNDKANELGRILESIRRQTTNVHLHVVTSFDVTFLQAHIENRDGTLLTRVHHDPTRQEYTLPYVIGHSTVQHSHWLRSALIRAVRYCSCVNDFNRERIYLEVTCFTNGYSLKFVEKRIHHFFTHFDAASLRLALDQHVYNQLRQRLFTFISKQQRAIEINQVRENNDELTRLSYVYEYGPKHAFNRQLHSILSTHLHAHEQFSKNKTKMILTTKHRHSLNALLARQKPTKMN
jgi:hypothetical protein